MNIFKKRKNILIIGTFGMLGSEVEKYFITLSKQKDNCIGKIWTVNRSEVDFSNYINASKYFNDDKTVLPDIVVNCAGYTDTTHAQLTMDGYERSMKANALLPKNLAEICAYKKIKLIHISTDYVYSEFCDDIHVSEFPVNTYGCHKLLGEKYIQAAYQQYKSSNYLIVRSSWLFGLNAQHKTFIERFLLNTYRTIANQLIKDDADVKNSKTIEISVDETNYGCPTSVWFMSSFLANAIENNLRGVVDVFQPHMQSSNYNTVNRFAWAEQILNVWNDEVRNFRDAIELKPVQYLVKMNKYEMRHPGLRTRLFNQHSSHLNSAHSYFSCIESANNWGVHTRAFIYRYGHDIEKWILSQLTPEQAKSITDRFMPLN